MKLKISLLAFSAIFILAACKSKKAAKSTSSVNMEPNEAMLASIKTRFSDATFEDLQNGKSIYYGACTHCHHTKNIVKREELEWASILDEMAPKAKLTTKERESVWKYIMGVKLAAK